MIFKPIFVSVPLEYFQTHLDRFLRTELGSLTYQLIEEGVARIYKISDGESLVCELDYIPVGTDIKISLSQIGEDGEVCLRLLNMISSTCQVDTSLQKTDLIAVRSLLSAAYSTPAENTDEDEARDIAKRRLDERLPTFVSRQVADAALLAERPWLSVEDKGYDRKLVRLLVEGKTDAEIGKSISVSPKRVSNRLTELRKKYPEMAILYRQKGKIGK